MKNLRFLLWVFVFVAGITSAQTVYITKTGEKYHESDCRYLSRSKIAIELKDALDRGYGACKMCSPPQTVSNKRTESKEETTEYNTTKNVEATQCTGTTQKGTRCKRMTKSTNGKCWQHGG